MGTTISLFTEPLPDVTVLSEDDFSVAISNYYGNLNSFITDMNVVAGEAETNAASAFTSASEAENSAILAASSADLAVSGANTSIWVSGTTYAAGVTRYSPINFLNYRRKTAGAGTADPSLDGANWALATVGIDARRRTVASSATPDIWGDSTQLAVDFTGSATVTDFADAPIVGAYRVLHCAGAVTFTHNANITVVGHNEDYTTESGDIARVHATSLTTFVVEVNPGQILPLFSSKAASRIPVSAGINLTANIFDTGLLGTQYVVRSDSLFIASGSSPQNMVATSPDGGDNWILRTMPRAQVWRIGASGNNLLAIDSGGTVTAKSTNGGLTWSSGANCSTSANNDIDNIPVENNGTWIIRSTSVTSCAVTTNLGTSWSTQVLPNDNVPDHFLVVGGLFWFWYSGTTAYTSPTGLTGSWSLAPLPIAPNVGKIWQNPGEDAIYIATTSGNIYKTIDGSSWVDTGDLVLPTQAGHKPIFKINDVFVSFEAADKESYVKHGKHVNKYWSQAGITSNSRLATDGAGTFLVPHAIGISQITPTSIYGVFK